MKKLCPMLVCVVTMALFGVVGTARAQIAQMPRELQHVGVTEHLDGPLPLETTFRDQLGNSLQLKDVIKGDKPIVLQFAYHSCPVVCSMITNNLAAGLKGVGWTVGKEFDVVVISIDPKESLEKTAAKRTSIFNEYGRGNINGWHFLVGDQAAIDTVTKAAGFEAQYDERQGQWAHPSVVFIVKPNGQMARYLYGLEFPPNDLKLGLFEASEGRSLSTVEQIIIYCYHYDPQGGKYVIVATRVMQVGAGLTAIILFGILGILWAREFRKAKKSENAATELSEGAAASAAVT